MPLLKKAPVIVRENSIHNVRRRIYVRASALLDHIQVQRHVDVPNQCPRVFFCRETEEIKAQGLTTVTLRKRCQLYRFVIHVGQTNDLTPATFAVIEIHKEERFLPFVDVASVGLSYLPLD